jgi:hypothetical protein
LVHFLGFSILILEKISSFNFIFFEQIIICFLESGSDKIELIKLFLIKFSKMVSIFSHKLFSISNG